ncbi:hypothetical protein IWX49DRAFT_580764 [Phyllosticta citricarpa]
MVERARTHARTHASRHSPSSQPMKPATSIQPVSHSPTPVPQKNIEASNTCTAPPSPRPTPTFCFLSPARPAPKHKRKKKKKKKRNKVYSHVNQRPTADGAIFPRTRTHAPPSTTRRSRPSQEAPLAPFARVYRDAGSERASSLASLTRSGKREGGPKRLDFSALSIR